MKPWVRVLLISLLAGAIFAIVAVTAYRFGFQAGVSHQFAGNFDSRAPLSTWGGRFGGWSDNDGPRDFSMMRGFHHMRSWSFGFFHPGFLLGVLVLGLLTYVLVKAFSRPAPEKPARTRRRS